MECTKEKIMQLATGENGLELAFELYKGQAKELFTDMIVENAYQYFNTYHYISNSSITNFSENKLEEVDYTYNTWKTYTKSCGITVDEKYFEYYLDLRILRYCFSFEIGKGSINREYSIDFEYCLL